jgi:hypothetical protein
VIQSKVCWIETVAVDDNALTDTLVIDDDDDELVTDFKWEDVTL